MKFHAEQAWVEGAWARDVLLEADAQGRWRSVQPGSPRPVGGVDVQVACALPGLVNAHSHAFQRAMAGLAEHADGAQDDFWSWRERMYRVALQIGPDELETAATWLYAELLRAGYTHVCEFHYLHRNLDGAPYSQATRMGDALIAAAQRTGIGLTLLPVVYLRRGFASDSLTDMQRRFRCAPEEALAMAQAVRTRAAADASAGLRLHAGVAVHSLRAVPPAVVREIDTAVRDMPLHIHVSEQLQEVHECLQHQGARPVDWLAHHCRLDTRWQLVHATHCTPQEIESVARGGAGVVLCPTTEANLGDGVFDLGSALQCGLRWSVGTDSHVNREWTEELRWLEYAQRLVRRQRNVSLMGQGGATAQRLFQQALLGGVAASGLPLGGFRVGERADLVEVDTQASALQGVGTAHRLEALVFSTPAAAPRRVFVAGAAVPDVQTAWRDAFRQVLQRFA